MFGAHDEDTFVRTLYDLNEKYPAYGTQAPMDSIFQVHSNLLLAYFYTTTSNW